MIGRIRRTILNNLPCISCASSKCWNQKKSFAWARDGKFKRLSVKPISVAAAGFDGLRCSDFCDERTDRRISGVRLWGVLGPVPGVLGCVPIRTPSLAVASLCAAGDMLLSRSVLRTEPKRGAGDLSLFTWFNAFRFLARCSLITCSVKFIAMRSRGGTSGILNVGPGVRVVGVCDPSNR